MMIALIVGNGEVSDEIKNELPENTFVICADGGIRHMKKLGLRPDIIIGDMDSADIEIDEEKAIRYPVKKDFTDSEISVDYAINHGFEEIIMLGFTGTRLDHTITNLFLLKKISESGRKGVIIDKHNKIFYAERENVILGKMGDIVSIIPIGEDVSGITTNGLEYPLNNETLEFGKSRGVSNVMTGECCEIMIESGTAMIIKSKD